MSESISFVKEYKAWAKLNNQHGKFAMSRFVMLKYLEAVQSVSDDFVFKGGNLLWHYIKTPRATVDLDLSTLMSRSGFEVKESLEKACGYFNNITFSILSFKSVEVDDGGGAAVTVGYRTESKQRNQFELDVVYALVDEVKQIKSTVSNNEIQSASIENIICDKISASYQFAGGNTRMKDFDDLWRISKSDKVINTKSLNDLMGRRELMMSLDKSWIDESMNTSWKTHQLKYKDLPQDLFNLFEEVNIWLESLSSD